MALTNTPYTNEEVGGNTQANRNVTSDRETIIQSATMPPKEGTETSTLSGPVTNDITPPTPTPQVGVDGVTQGYDNGRKFLLDKNGKEITSPTPQVPTNTGNQGLGEAPTYPENKPADQTDLTPVGNGPSPVYENKKGDLTTGTSPLVDPVAEAKKQIEEENKIKQQEADKVRQETIDQIKNETKTQDQITAEEKGYTFKKNKDGSITFSPKDLDEAIDIYTTFGKTSKLDKFSKAAIVGTAVYENYSQYKGATSDVYLQGFRTNDIGIGGQTWNQLVKMNGGQPTAEMLKAQEQWQQGTKTGNVNNTITTFSDKEITSTTDKLATDLKTLDQSYNTFISKAFAGIDADYTIYKSGNDKLKTLNDTVNSTATQIDELNKRKMQLKSDIRKQYPNLPLSQQLAKADAQIEEIDNQLFTLQIQHNSAMADYKYEDTKNREEFEYNTKIAEKKMNMAEKLYDVKRGDIIRIDDINRADKKLADEIARAEQAKKDAIVNGDRQAAIEQAYKIALMQEEAKLNKEAQKTFTGYSVEGGIMSFDSTTGKAEFIPANGSGTGTSTVTSGTTGNRPDRNNNPGNLKMGDVGFGVDDQNHTIFGDAQSGYEAMKKDIQAKMTGNTRTGLTGNSTLAELGKVYAEDPKWADGVSKLSGYSLDTKIGTMDINKIAPAIAKQEGFTGNITNGVASNATTTSGVGELQQLINQYGLETAVTNIGKAAFGSGRSFSDNDYANAQKIVEKNPNATIEDLKDVLGGFFLMDGKNTNLANALKNTVLANVSRDVAPLGNLADAINRGDENFAIKGIETAVINTIPEEKKIREDTIKTVIDQTKELDKLIKEGEAIVGPMNGTIQQFMGRLQEEGVTNIENKIQQLISPERNKLIGAGMTGAETSTIAPLFPSITDKKDAMLAKVANMQTSALRELNNFRTSIGLPAITEKQVGAINYKDRAELYAPTPKKQTSFQKIQGNTSTMSNDSVYEEFDTITTGTPTPGIYPVKGFNY